MKAIVYTKYGSPEVLQLKDVEKPVPKDTEVLVKIHAASLNSWDWDMLRGIPRIFRLLSGIFKPKYNVLGADIAGEILEVGSEVRKFQKGDMVLGDLCEGGWGAFAEYTCAGEKDLVLKPAEMAFEDAASLPQAAVMSHLGIHVKGQVTAGEKVLINGAGGGVGSFAIQMAKDCGAEITAVDRADKFDLMRSLGAEQCIDFTREDFTRNGQNYDLILDIMGHHSIFDYKRALGPQGRYLMIGGSVRTVFQTLFFAPFISKRGGKNLGILAHKPNKSLESVIELITNGKVKAVIDKRYKLNDVPKAFQYLGDGNARGKIIIHVS